jgi:tetratricopeptide (TPR) repeat protein
VKGPALVPVGDDALGLAAAVPRSWIQGSERYGQLAFANGLPGMGRASFTAQAQALAVGSVDDAAQAFVQHTLAPEEKSGNLRDVVAHPARPATVGGFAGRLLEASYLDDGMAVRLRAYFVQRGELTYELVYQWSDDYPAYEPLMDRMVARVAFAEQRAVREGRARALLDPSTAALTALGDTLARTGEPAGAVAALEWAVVQSPEDAEAHARLAQALLSQGHGDKGCRSAEAAVGMMPDSALSLEVMGSCRLSQGDRLGAIRYLRKAVEAAPRDERLAARLRALQ